MGFPDVGDDFGRYQITGRIGRGGVGVVFSAAQRGLERSVALKVLSPELASEPHFRRRFTREASVLASLFSPHIIQIYDHGEYNGCLFIATQFVAGGDLWDWLVKNGGMAPRQALDVVAQVSSALADAHAAGVIHRDIKPSNVLLHRSGEEEVFAYLCDFGIARADNWDHTRTLGLIGTLSYMAPERHEGTDASVSSDVYSLGCLLWAALTGSPPYEGGDVQVAIRHMRDPIPTYPDDGAVPQAINAILQRSMAKDPSERYPTAGAMRTDLIGALQLFPGVPVRSNAESKSVDAAKDRQVSAGQGQTSARLAQGRPQKSDELDPPARPAALVGRSPRRRRRAIPLLAGLFGLVAAGVVGVVTIWALANDSVTCADGSQTTDRSDCPVAEGRPTPSTSPSSSGNVGPETVTCWDGRAVSRMSQCTLPRGVTGLRWVYPSLDRDIENCDLNSEPDPDGKIRAVFCPFAGSSLEGIRYSEWQTAADATAHYNQTYAQVPREFSIDGRQVGNLWRLETPKRNGDGLFRMTIAYRDKPYSITVESVSSEGVDEGCTQAILRSFADFTSTSSSCD